MYALNLSRGGRILPACIVNGNIYSPEEYPAGWKEEE